MVLFVRMVLTLRLLLKSWQLSCYQKAKVLFGYVGRDDEVNTSPVLRQALSEGKRVGVPLCAGPGVMEVREIESLEDLNPGFCGMKEPDRTCPLIRPDEIDLVLVPCLSCTRDGTRLGYGGGYYDRYLKKVRGTTLAIFRERLLSASLPVEPHDIPVLGVITENTVYFY